MLKDIQEENNAYNTDSTYDDSWASAGTDYGWEYGVQNLAEDILEPPSWEFDF
jgi:hypothetical protein